MLYEIPHPRQSNRSLVKRWFTSNDMDLFIWHRQNVPVRFQLTYNKRNAEKAISWDFHLGFRHYLVDGGETIPNNYPGRYKQTPILIDLCDQKNLAQIARDFLAASENIDIAVSDFIYARLMAHPTTTGRRGATSTDQFPAR